MKIDLSPGEWAGVMDAVAERASREADHELRDDLWRIARLIRQAIEEDGRELPELVPGEPNTTVTCQHVMTPQDVRARIERNEAVKERWAGHSDRECPAYMLWPVGLPGEQCGLPLYVNVLEWDHRKQSEWLEDGAIYVGKSVDTETVDMRFGCEAGHDWELPETGDWG